MIGMALLSPDQTGCSCCYNPNCFTTLGHNCIDFVLALLRELDLHSVKLPRDIKWELREQLQRTPKFATLADRVTDAGLDPTLLERTEDGEGSRK